MALPIVRRSGAGSSVQWDPFADFEELYERMGRILGDGLQGWSGIAGSWVPGIDLEETEEAYLVEVDLPGVRRSDLSVEYRDGELTISGEVKQRERTGTLRRQTRKVGSFEARVAVPGEVDSEHIDADLADGVLSIRLPKAPQARPKRIEIGSGAAKQLNS